MCDQIAVSVFKSLVRDFQNLHGETFAQKALEAICRSVGEYRAYVYPELGDVDPYRFKAYWQLQHLFKRYRFTDDMYTDAQLDELTTRKFVESNTVRSIYHPLRLSTVEVTRVARKICKGILTLPFQRGQGCRNGVKSTRMVTLENAFLDEKWGNPAGFDCPSALRSEFMEFLKTPHTRQIAKRLLASSKERNLPLDLSADDLNLILVPKSWKTHRPITPMSVFGLYWSFGVGGYVERCLRNVGLDITTLQRRHQMLVCKYSKSRTHATADLSSASDSIRRDHLNRVLPRWFYNELKRTFVDSLVVSLDGHKTTIHTSSCLPMGNGATFPVETLYFYCLIKAIGDLLKVKGVYSVYGDDLIYPSSIHTYVVGVFDDLGIMVNREKTFVSSYFRESCGSDYYRGVNVRPSLFPEEQAFPERKLTYVSWLYKIVNSLLARWSHHEIPTTINFLLGEISYARGEIHVVPPSFPSSSGIQLERPIHPDWLRPFVLPRIIAADKTNGSAYLLVKFIGNSPPRNRKILYEDIYYFDKLGTVDADRIPPPSYKEGWGRWKCPGMTRQLARWFLKSTSFHNGEARVTGQKVGEEPTRKGSKTKISVARLSAWL